MADHHPRCHFIQYGGGNCDCDYGNLPAPATGLPDTPRTDELDEKLATTEVLWRYVQMRSLARQLERALIETRREREEAIRLAQLAQEWIEDSEGFTVERVLEIEDNAKVKGKTAWNQKFVALCRAARAFLKDKPQEGQHGT